MPIPVILLLIVGSERWLSSTIMVIIMRLGGKLVTVGGCLSPPCPTRGPTRRGGTRRVLLWFRTPILLGPCFKGKLVQLHPYVTQERAWPLGYDRYSGAWRYPVVFRTPTSGHASSLCRACDSSHHLRGSLPHPRVWRPWTSQARMPLGPASPVLWTRDAAVRWRDKKRTKQGCAPASGE